MTTTNPDQINIDSDDDDDVLTSNTAAPLPNNNEFLPLDTSCTVTQGLTEMTENRKRFHNDDNNGKRNVVIKRRNASLYQSQDNDDNNS